MSKPQGLQVGIIGCGHISAAHIKSWQRLPGVAVTTVFDLGEALANARAKEFGIEHVSSSVDELIDRVDVVDICTPPATHAALALQAIDADRHVLIEKPVVIEESDWDAMAAALGKGKAKLAVVHNIKFGNAILEAKQRVDAGDIGRLVRIERNFLTHPTHDRMLTTEQAHWSHALPGGRWFETLPHELYLNHFFAGALELNSVTCVRTPAATSAVRADEVTLTFKGDDVISVVQYSANCELNIRNVRFVGERGVLTVDILSDAVSVATARESKRRRAVGVEYLRSAESLMAAPSDRLGYAGRRLRGDTPHSRVIKQFAEYLRGKADSPTPFDEVDYVVRNCYRVGRAIDEQIASA